MEICFDNRRYFPLLFKNDKVSLSYPIDIYFWKSIYKFIVDGGLSPLTYCNMSEMYLYICVYIFIYIYIYSIMPIVSKVF